MDKELTLEDFLTGPLAEEIKKLLKKEIEPIGPTKRIVSRQIIPIERETYHGISKRDSPYDDAPDDPNLIDTPSGRDFERSISDAHDGLERDYVYTLDGGRQIDAGDAGQKRAYLNPEIDQEIIIPPPQSVEHSLSFRGGEERVLSTLGRGHFNGLATEVYIGMRVLDRLGQEWSILSVQESTNIVLLQRSDGMKARVALNKLLGKDLPPCPFKIDEFVEYEDKRTKIKNIYKVIAINENSQLLTIEIDGKKRQVRFSQIKLGNKE